MISGDERTDGAISDTAKAMSRSGQILEAKTHAMNIQNPDIQAMTFALIEIMEKCKEKQFSEALEQAKSFALREKIEAYQNISLELLEEGKWEESIQMASSIPHEISRKLSLECLLKRLQREKNEPGIDLVNSFLQIKIKDIYVS